MTAPLWWPLGVRCLTPERSELRPFNARLARSPRWVARPSSLVGLQRIVRACTTRGVRFGVWGAGFGSQEGLSPVGVLLDLRALHHLEVFPEERFARVGPGVRVGELDARTTSHGLAAVCPRFSGLSVLGATLGGGTGWLSRRWGFGAQGIRAASVVSPDGQIVRATEEHHPDLLWALRGAGQGGFGVVTSLDLELREIPREVWAGKITWPMSQAPAVLGRLPAALEQAGASLFVFVSLRSRGPQGPSFSLSGVYLGEGSRGREVFDGLCGLAPGAEIEQGATTYLACQSEFQDPAGRTPSFQWRHGFVRRGESAAWGREVVEGLRRHPGLELRFNLESMGEAMARQDATRLLQSQEASFLYVAAGVWDVPALGPPTTAALASIDASLRPLLLPHGHPNYDDQGVLDRPTHYFGRHAPKLMSLRRQYDPMKVGWSILDDLKAPFSGS